MPDLKLTKNKTFILCFFFLTFISIVLLFCSSLNFKYYFHQDNADSFMDLYNSVISQKYAAKEAGVGGFYPPLSIIPYRIMGYGVKDIDNSLLLRQQAFVLRNSVYGAFLLFLHLMPFLFSFFIIIFYAINGTDKRKLFYSLILSCSGLILWSLERGNIIIYAFIFTMLFVLLYQSENKKYQILAYICLAVAANLKLYPAVFGLLLIERKDWNGIIKCAGAFILIYLLSFIFCTVKLPFSNGAVSASTDLNIYASFGVPLFDMIKAVFSNISNGFAWGERTAPYGSGLNFSIVNLCKLAYLFVLKITHLNMENADIIELYYVSHIGIYRITACLVFAVGIFSFFFSDEKWKKLAIPAFLCFYIPPTSWMYVLIFMFIPFVEFINSEQKSVFDNIYSMVFAVIFALVIIPCKIPAEVYYITGAFALQSVALLFMYLCIFISALRNLFDLSNMKTIKDFNE